MGSQTLPTWTVQVTWFDDGREVLHGGATIEGHPDVIDPLVYLTLVVKCITTTGKWGCARLADMDATADRRDTAIVLRNGSRSRSMAVSQRYERIDDEEAEECANKVMDWLMADETTELLGCSSSPFRRR